jgi:hypothetical protein
MAIGNMQFGNNGVGNNAGPDQTTLTSTHQNSTLRLSNTANGPGLLATGSRGGVNGQGTGGSAGYSASTVRRAMAWPAEVSSSTASKGSPRAR